MGEKKKYQKIKVVRKILSVVIPRFPDGTPIKGIEKEGNIKLSNGRTKTTFYSCVDKDSPANTRLENKVEDIRSIRANKEKLENEIKKYVQEMKGLEFLVEKVECKYIEELAKLYQETKGKKYRTFSEFVACMDSQGYIMTL